MNLSTFVGSVQELAILGSEGKGLFVRIIKKRVLKEAATSDTTTKESSVAAPTKLGMGVDGGFASEQDKYDTISTYSVVLLEKKSNESVPTVLVELPYCETHKNDFPTNVTLSVDSIINHVGVLLQQDVQQWQLEEDIPVSKYAENLPFMDNGIKIDPNAAHWKCEKYPDAERSTENLWLNLSDGFIGGGRKNWDGSGGTGGALDHFQETGKLYPLVVKLGTITGDIATADCYSYAPDEDGPVKIPNLKKLLEKRGIHIAAMQKTVKSTAELEVELNANYAFDAITEAGAHLIPVSGPSLQGLQNLGNSCYLNSVLQALFSGTVPELAKRYGTTANGSLVDHPFLQRSHSAPWDDLLCQTTKVACALTSGNFALPISKLESDSDAATDPKYRLAPRMFKHVVGKEHVDFRTMQQQDAAQFLQYLLEKMDQAELAAVKEDPKIIRADSDENVHVASHIFSFSTRRRLVCSADEKVKYKDDAPENVWSLRIPMDKAVVVEADQKEEEIASPEHKRLKSDEMDKKPVPTIAFSTCVEEWAHESMIQGMEWAHLQKEKHPALERTRFANFPRYLVIQMQRYQLGADWIPIKLEVNLDIPEEIDLTQYRCSGPQDGEQLVPDIPESQVASAQPLIDEGALSQLLDMGFSLNSCKRALMAVGGSDTEAAMNWVFEHNSDPDFNDPLPEPGPPAAPSSGTGDVDEGVVQSLVENLGCFSAHHVRAALKETNGAMDRAADWLFSNMDDMDNAIAALQIKEASSTFAAASLPLEDGEGKYTMIGMISHIGKNTGSGHYVAHLKQDKQWVIFNDEKVALSSRPPFEHAYMYLFKRKDTEDAPDPNY